MLALKKNSLFTNVGMTASHEPWWEGIELDHGPGMLDWQGQPFNPQVRPAAHPNSRYTVPAHQAPCISPEWENPAGVPISAFIFGGRRAKTAPLVYEAFDWQHGVFVGATMGSETTAAATGKVGVLRRDPMAMLPFCGYNMADYWAHWLDMGRRIPHPPKIFHVNWFRKGADGKFLWPGFGENVRVLKWILERVEGKGKAMETPIGFVPTEDALTLDGLNISRDTMRALLNVDPGDYAADLEDVKKFFDQFGDHLPPEMRAEHEALAQRLQRVMVAQK
jgi:phosphoenolpyruvate carboxykinase (GTP)